MSEDLRQSIQCVRKSYGLLKTGARPEEALIQKPVRKKDRKKARKQHKRKQQVDHNLSQERRLYTCTQCYKQVALRPHGAVVCQSCGCHVVCKHRLKRPVQLEAV